jgi:hypothetical protein
MEVLKEAVVEKKSNNSCMGSGGDREDTTEVTGMCNEGVGGGREEGGERSHSSHRRSGVSGEAGGKDRGNQDRGGVNSNMGKADRRLGGGDRRRGEGGERGVCSGDGVEKADIRDGDGGGSEGKDTNILSEIRCNAMKRSRSSTEGNRREVRIKSRGRFDCTKVCPANKTDNTTDDCDDDEDNSNGW